MLSSTLTLLCLTQLFTAAKAIYFTAPQSSTVWTTPQGQLITWYHQAGDALVGDILLQNVADTTTVQIAGSISLVSPQSLVFPSGFSLSSPTTSYRLQIVSSADPTHVYSSVGPFTILSFTSSTASNTSTNPLPSPVLPNLPVTTKPAQTEGSPVTATNPAISSATSTSTSTSGMVTSFVSTSTSSVSSSTMSGNSTSSATALAIKITTSPTSSGSILYTSRWIMIGSCGVGIIGTLIF